MISPIHLVSFFIILNAVLGQQQQPPRRQLRQRHSNQPQNTIINNTNNSTTSKPDIPSLEYTIEFAALSNAVYDYHTLDYTSCTSRNVDPMIYEQDNATSNANSTDGVMLPKNVTCEMYYHDKEESTQVLIVTSTTKKYIAVIYAGTDDIQTTILDGAFLQTTFDPNNNNISDDVRVHSGFHRVVFSNGIYDRVLNKVVELKGRYEEYDVVTSGHSLGAASSILTAVAFAKHFKKDVHHANESMATTTMKEEEKILVINFGCPRIGNKEWQSYVHSLSNLSIYRFVLGRDIVPRVPPILFFYHHVGHLVQMNADEMLLYYSQIGDEKKGYAGAPYTWDIWPVVWIPGALVKHYASKYLEYLVEKSRVDLNKFYVHDFERLENSSVVSIIHDDEVDDNHDLLDSRSTDISFRGNFKSSQ